MTTFIEQLGTVNLFHQLSDEELALFKNRFQKTAYQAGDYVFRENDVGDTLYIVEKGVVSLNQNITVDVEKTLFAATEGMVFGEFSFMDAGERSASARVDEDAELIFLKKDDFENFAQEHPAIGTKLYGNLLVILVDRLRKTNEAYRESIRWGLEVTGTLKLNFQYLITEDVDICIELTSGRTYEGRVLQLEKSDAGHEVIMLDRDGQLVLIPYHAIAAVTLASSGSDIR